MERVVIGVLFVLVVAGTVLFSVDHLAFGSFSLFTGPAGRIASFEPRATAAVLLAGLAVALFLLFVSARRIASERAAWASLGLAIVSTPVLLAPFSIGPELLAAPLVLLLAYQLSTRKYRLWSIALPIAALIALGFGYYPLFVLASLLVTTPLRPDPDPRIGELFMLTAVAVVAVGPGPIAPALDPERIYRLGLVFIALAAFAAYLVISRATERAYPFIAAGLAGLALYVLGDPLGPMVITLAGASLAAVAFEALLRFVEVSNLRWKRTIPIVVVSLALVLTLTQSLFIATVTVDNRMSPALADSLRSVQGPVAISADLAPAVRYYADTQVVPLSGSDVETLTGALFTTQVIEFASGRFSRFVLPITPAYAADPCFSVEPRGMLTEVTIECSLS